MLTILALVLLATKILADYQFGHKALKEVKLLREAVVSRLDSHDARIGKLEDRVVSVGETVKIELCAPDA